MAENTLLNDVAEKVQWHMDEILRSFKPGVKITVLVRTPGYPTRDFMMTSDDAAEVIEMVKRRMEAQS